MVDKLSKSARSENMRRIKGRDTKPEMAVRRALHANGLRYRLHRKDLPGKPDIVMPGRKLCIFVHGCFWHGCTKCVDGKRTVKSNTDFWKEKIQKNRMRDAKNRKELLAQGWTVYEIWECETRDEAILSSFIKKVRKLPTQPH